MPASDRSAPVVVSFSLARDEFLAAWRGLYRRQLRAALRLPALGVVLAVFGVVDSLPVMILAGLLVAFFCPLASYVITPRDLWHKMEQGPQTHTFTEDQIISILPHAESRFDWSYWREVSLVADTYVLQSARGYIFIPRRAFSAPEDERSFRSLAALPG